MCVYLNVNDWYSSQWETVCSNKIVEIYQLVYVEMGVPIMARYKFNYGAVLMVFSMKKRYIYETQLWNGTLFARYLLFFWAFFVTNIFKLKKEFAHKSFLFFSPPIIYHILHIYTIISRILLFSEFRLEIYFQRENLKNYSTFLSLFECYKSHIRSLCATFDALYSGIT